MRELLYSPWFSFPIIHPLDMPAFLGYCIWKYSAKWLSSIEKEKYLCAFSPHVTAAIRSNSLLSCLFSKFLSLKQYLWFEAFFPSRMYYYSLHFSKMKLILLPIVPISQALLTLFLFHHYNVEPVW